MKSKIIKRILVYLVAIGVFAGLVFATVMYVRQARKKIEQSQQQVIAQTQAEAETRLTKVKVVEVLPIPFTDYLVLPGTVKAYEDIDLAANVGGTVAWIGPKEGNRVKKGETLLEIDMKSEETRVTEARVWYEQALKDFERIEKLYNEQIASKGQYDNAKTALETAKTALEAADVNLSDGVLLSPITGVLDRLNVDEGEFIAPGQTVMKIVDIDRVKVELPVPEKDILFFKKGQKAKIEMEMTTKEKWEFTGVIDFISLTADSDTRTYLVKVVVDNPDRILRPGMIVRAHLVRRELKDAIAVPFFTIIDREDGKAVFVVEDNVASVRAIEYGSFTKGLVEIRSGLSLGEKLIVVGQRNLVDGEKVNVTADLTLMAKQWLAAGKDFSELPMELIEQASQ